MPGPSPLSSKFECPLTACRRSRRGHSAAWRRPRVTGASCGVRVAVPEVSFATVGAVRVGLYYIRLAGGSLRRIADRRGTRRPLAWGMAQWRTRSLLSCPSTVATAYTSTLLNASRTKQRAKTRAHLLLASPHNSNTCTTSAVLKASLPPRRPCAA